ncbi:hypothetical protein N7474_000809 [Penicillium riverlandense]|uniref:uncharacterized protein n=1 Tax=Penicillium riverlandense TaxID=1903569 RepID=UPI002546BA88|nr:uncharacterized protein N7474_000809 [Penicillium riverlandense]KAJ5832498.1 hypothetical protein N7474_000809 [Penicillium riverlandense]
MQSENIGNVHVVCSAAIKLECSAGRSNLVPSRFARSSVLLFQRIEAVFGEIFAPIHQSSLQDWQRHGELVHASGLAALVQEKGPPKPKDKSDASVIIDSHACIIHQALVQGKVCFLASNEWAAALDNIEGRTDIQTIFYQILRQMTLWPTLLHEKKSTLYDGDLVINLSSLIDTAQRVQTAMYDIGLDLDTLIETRRVCRTIPSTCLSDLVTEMYEVDDTMVGVVLCYHAMYSIVVLRIIWSVTDVLHRIVLEFDIFHLCKRVWMLIEHGRQCMPLGLPILQTALMMTMESVDWDAQERIVNITNELDRFHEPGRITWTRAALIKKAMVYRGDCAIYHG